MVYNKKEIRLYHEFSALYRRKMLVNIIYRTLQIKKFQDFHKKISLLPGAPLTDVLRADLEVVDLSGDAVACIQCGEEIPRPPEGGQLATPTGLAAEAVAGIVHAVLNIVGDLPHLLHPVLPLFVAWPPA